MIKINQYVGRIFFAALLLLIIAVPARAELRVDITRGVVKPIPVAVTNLLGASAKEQNIGRNIANVIKADLVRSGLFAAIDSKAFIDVENSLNTVPKFGSWRVLKAQALSQGAVQLEAGNKLKVQFR
ncbi:MAG TPA: Tol-Pal system protein TolB, partial [Rhodospirillales bacterium]|nr:Tol-Pal system protein TolB [Rhodospirillales bacterium]